MPLQISAPLTLPCGLTLPNRLSKAAMAENLASGPHLPTPTHNSSYSVWGAGDWGMIMTGNVQVDPIYLGGPGDISFDATIDRARRLETWKAWATATQSNGSPGIVQINHPGRQSPMGTGKKGLLAKNLAPSAVGVKLGEGLLAKALSSLVFGTPREMTTEDISHAIEAFVDTATLAAESGFKGVEIHAAHGYLLAQFLSADSNRRTDAYGGSAKARAKIVVEVIEAIRAAVPKDFAVGIKLNSVDHQSQQALAHCVEQLQLIASAGIDFLEISGGTYEDPKMFQPTPTPTSTSSRTQAREAFFLEFARAIRRSVPTIPLMVTGGFRTRLGMEAAVANGDCDLVGLGRPAVIYPTLPRDVIFNTDLQDEDAILPVERIEVPWILKQTGLKAVGAGAESSWYGKRIGEMKGRAQKV
ncbi:NADPH dehydrogenase [Elsinoe ampelina]|uniref:NADPH dehydrogenase n=1 Tax=Elsinoe ampelina TaxID=302913 RepID=A0A6A6GAW0_9PEZI|nr:NADPH dehydrogenase [Elsinoe ampelina]